MTDYPTRPISPGHPTVPLTHPIWEEWHGKPVLIDADLAEIIRLCWDLGIDTNGCCQEGEDGRAEINFFTLDDMDRFYDAVADPNEPNWLFEDCGWQWSLWVDGGLLGEVRIPRRDLPWLETRLREAVAETE